MLTSKVWVCGILFTILLISIIIVWAGKEAYREHADDEIPSGPRVYQNSKVAGDLLDWGDYINIQTKFAYKSAFPHVDTGVGKDGEKDGFTGGRSGNRGYFLASCGKCNSGDHCAGGGDCETDSRFDVSAHPNNEPWGSSKGKTVTWRILQTPQAKDGHGYLGYPVYGDSVYLTSGKVNSEVAYYLEVCGNCHHHCSNCNVNISDVIMHDETKSNVPATDSGKSRWKVKSAVGIPNGRRIRYGEPIYLQNVHYIGNSKLKVGDGSDQSDRQPYLDMCGKCDDSSNSTDKCVENSESDDGDGCDSDWRRDVSTSFSPRRASAGAKAGSGTWRFLPSHYSSNKAGHGWGWSNSSVWA